MPKRKANWWPASILSDPDVLSVDDEGRFVLCKICHVHYAVHGGKKPKPVIMNSNFRTRARQQTYTSGELHAAKTLVQTESGTFGGNENAKVAKKLRSLNDEYHASNMRHADAYNMRHPEVFDRRSAGYKEYWGTLRDVYTSSGSFGTTATCRKSHHRHGTATTKPVPNANKEAEADSTTPDDSGSSDDAFKPTVIVHDATLLGAIERLTDATTKQIASLYAKETLDTREELRGLTSVMTDLRVQHGHAFGRIIELQEKHLKVMEGILEVKLRKEAARNANSSNSANSANINTGNNTNKDRQGEDKRPSQNGEKAHPSAA
ncbi:hypothetical protein JM16_003465 [Phytophthora kernoviae]|uniref:PWWP domain-containing protein n=1 Tax=Phytophthora kernoviae TaxID=325452 RepID=A0A8T0M3C7_9STRA|nr:hypothetical protein JM16_003465 [Phytophthora kernoviae]